MWNGDLKERFEDLWSSQQDFISIFLNSNSAFGLFKTNKHLLAVEVYPDFAVLATPNFRILRLRLFTYSI